MDIDQASKGEGPIKTGAWVVRHHRYVASPTAEVALPRMLFAGFLRLIARLGFGVRSRLNSAVCVRIVRIGPTIGIQRVGAGAIDPPARPVSVGACCEQKG